MDGPGHRMIAWKKVCARIYLWSLVSLIMSSQRRENKSNSSLSTLFGICLNNTSSESSSKTWLSSLTIWKFLFLRARVKQVQTVPMLGWDHETIILRVLSTLLLGICFRQLRVRAAGALPVPVAAQPHQGAVPGGAQHQLGCHLVGGAWHGAVGDADGAGPGQPGRGAPPRLSYI